MCKLDNELMEVISGCVVGSIIIGGIGVCSCLIENKLTNVMEEYVKKEQYSHVKRMNTIKE